ncbi:hypothetical protein ACFQ1E_02045 [Sphingomonas canadensis]|uniref:DUF308 domain-containing protein n=1 Tax=Sphingomonas canadensis TaxID=1219257 RepID=A0ABW3H6U8_9SPHN|nr:hypothetical protein [Sphingomonas canadensis]MCW3834978.1 hypothetical protein [Sphingomonas canadensis]
MTDELDSEHAPMDLRPLLVTLLGIALLVGLAILAPIAFPRLTLPLLVAASAGLGLVFWGAGYLFAIRHAPLKWKLGSLAALVGAGALAGLAADRLYHAGASTDASSFAEAEVSPGGTINMPRGATGRGPVSKRFVAFQEEAAAAQRDYGKALGKLQFASLTNPYALEEDPAVLENCGAIAAFKPKADEYAAKTRERIAAMTQAIAASNFTEALKQGATKMAVVPGFDDGAAARDAELLATGEALCRLLAKRSWRNIGGYFAFSGGDGAEYRKLMDRLVGVAGAARKAQMASYDRIVEGQEQVRDALAR